MDKSRKIYVNNEKYDITIIEIKHNDGIDMNNFLDVMITYIKAII